MSKDGMDKGMGAVPRTPKTEKVLVWWADDIAHGFKPLCRNCRRWGTMQTAKGKYAQENLHRPVNWGYYCRKHWNEGVELENEAIYG
jgi:hypothetical protein